jgi:hypothetical protein
MPITNSGEKLAMENALGTASTVRLHTSNPGPTGDTNNTGLIDASSFSATGGGISSGFPQTGWIFNTTGTETTNANAINFTLTATGPLTVTHISVLKGASTGTYVWYAPVGPITWSNGQTIEFPAGSIKLNISNS